MFCVGCSVVKRTVAAVGAVFLLYACSQAARAATEAEAEKSFPQLIDEVKPSVALVEVVEKGKRQAHGSGFIVDESGIIATNYHVIEGAKEIRVSFPGDKSKGTFKSQGYIGYYIKKDMALIKIDPGDKKLIPLPLAKELPHQGEPVAAFGAPLGFEDTVTRGIVSAVREGKDLRKMLMHGNIDGYGKDGLGYEENATWIQTDTPVSPGNSGGPLVNFKGEVIGINTFVSSMGQNLNFSLSIKHMIKFIADSGKNVQEYASLPKPREHHGGGGMGDPKKNVSDVERLEQGQVFVGQASRVVRKKVPQAPPN